MRVIRKILEQGETYEGYSIVSINVIAHGDSKGNIMNAGGSFGWNINDIVGVLSDIEALLEKPKLFFVNACRGCKSI